MKSPLPAAIRHRRKSIGEQASSACRRSPLQTAWRLALLAGLLLLVGLWASCGGGGGQSFVSHNPGTPAGVYTLTVTGTTTSGSTTLTHKATLTLTVQ